jgi:hypothetical protein
MQIRSQLEYEATMILIQDMSGAPEDTPGERLLIRLVLSVDIWEAQHGLDDRQSAPSRRL